MMDGPVDVSGTDQQNIVVRFVSNDGKIHELLLGFEIIISGTGESLWDLVSEKLKAVCLPITSLIRMSLDGASANRTENVGVIKFYRDEVPAGHFVCGFAHQQNLVVAPVFAEIEECRNLLGLLQELCSCFNESARRMLGKLLLGARHSTADLTAPTFPFVFLSCALSNPINISSLPCKLLYIPRVLYYQLEICL